MHWEVASSQRVGVGVTNAGQLEPSRLMVEADRCGSRGRLDCARPDQKDEQLSNVLLNSASAGMHHARWQPEFSRYAVGHQTGAVSNHQFDYLGVEHLRIPL